MANIRRRYGLEPTTAELQIQKASGYMPHESFRPLPSPPGPHPYRMPLADLGPDPTDSLVVQFLGDSGGVLNPTPQKKVAAVLAADPANLVYHLGDVVYFLGEHDEYYPQFYEPYELLNRPFVAIPGNHDGDGFVTLDGFLTNFCAPSPTLTPDAKDAVRDAMTQPNVYWTLTANLATIIGLYTNVPSGGQVDSTQAAWLEGELADAPKDRPVIVTLHHPPYSADAHHGGSARMGSLLDTACTAAGRWPALVLSGHVHNYQRFTRHPLDGRPAIPYIVAGAGGYHNLHGLASGLVLGQPVAGSDVTYEAGLDKTWGYLHLTITRGLIAGEYRTVDGTASVDSFVVRTV